MIVLTGAAGFIGSAFLGLLNSKGYTDILVVDSFANAEKWPNLLGKKFREYLHKQEFLNKIKQRDFSKQISAIIHMGACSSTTESNVDYLMENNFRYSVEIAKFCAEKNVRLIYASSAATYGGGELGFSDLDPIDGLRPLNAYGFSKQVFDLWLQAEGLGQAFTGLKFFNVFGPNEYHKGEMRSMVLKGYAQVKESGKIKLFKSNHLDFADGEQKRDFFYVKDCCQVMLWILEAGSTAATGLYNLGFGKARSWNDLAQAIFVALALKPKIEYIDIPEHLSKQYQNFTEAKIDKLRQAGFKNSFTSLEDSVADYINNYLQPQKYL